MARHTKAIVQGFCTIAAAMVLYFVLQHRIAGVIVAGIGVLVIVGGLFIPPLYHALDRFARLLARCFGAGIKWLLFTPLYYLAFVPARLMLKLSGRDPMQRSFRRGEQTCWIEKPREERTADDYRRMH